MAGDEDNDKADMLEEAILEKGDGNGSIRVKAVIIMSQRTDSNGIGIY